MENLAADLIVCGVTDTTHPKYATYGHACNFNDLILLMKNVITNLVFISTILATIVFFYIGFVLLTSGGDTGAKEKAKHAAGSLIKGYLCIIVAWLVVYTISSALLKDGYSLLGN